VCHHWGTSPGTLAELVRRDVFTRLFVADVIVDSSAFVQFQESPAMLADRGDDPPRYFGLVRPAIASRWGCLDQEGESLACDK